MNITKLKKEYVGKKLLNIIDLDLNNEAIINTLQRMTNSNYSKVDNAKILLFEEKKALIFVDFDCDGYRSGNWHLIHVEELLDKEQTKGIKIINSVVRNIEYFNKNDTETILITTDDYVISMGQSHVSDYYPSNFFNLEECKQFALTGKWEEVKRGEDE